MGRWLLVILFPVVWLMVIAVYVIVLVTGAGLMVLVIDGWTDERVLVIFVACDGVRVLVIAISSPYVAK